jgi:acetyl-CoA carboxylase biotin carboxyl carrier protein
MARTDGKDEAIELVRQLAEVLTDKDLSEIEVERGELRVRVARGVEVAPMPAYAPAYAPPPAPAPQAAPAPHVAAADAPRTLQGELVKSPMVGTVYLQPSPGADRFVKPGDQVSAGQTLMIIEAMKTMNPVPAPRAGKVLEIVVDDGQPVEFGEPLVVLE